MATINGTNGNTLNSTVEFVFSQYLENVKTNLDGLQAFDNNPLNNQDEPPSQFPVWQDKNKYSQSDEGELFGLEQLGITAINLVSDHQAQHLNCCNKVLH